MIPLKSFETRRYRDGSHSAAIPERQRETSRQAAFSLQSSLLRARNYLPLFFLLRDSR